MFSSPVTVTRKIFGTSQRTKRRTIRYMRGGCCGSGWTRGSIGASTSARYSGPVYDLCCAGGRLRPPSSGGEEIFQHAVELLRTLCLRSVAGALQNSQPRARDQPVRIGRVSQREERVVVAPDQLYRHFDLRKPLRQVVVGVQQGLGRYQRADGGQIGIRVALCSVELA